MFFSFIKDNNNLLLYSKNKIMLSQGNTTSNSFGEIYTREKKIFQNILFSDFFNLIILIPNSIQEIECINIVDKKKNL